MSILHNDEGMWLLNQLPHKRLKQLYNFEPTPQWVEHVQKASVRMNNGGSASFVSPFGLIATNCHIAESILHDLSLPGKDYIRDGFYASTFENEVKVPQLEVNVLWEIIDVTDRIEQAVKKHMSPTSVSAVKKTVMAKIEKDSFEKTGLRSDVITLYQGGAYHLYRYKKYTDIRLVWAPEKAISRLGDDFDNYEYPRYCLDVSFLRVYENDAPLATEHFFKWSDKNSKEGGLLFISGHPGSTDRLSTLGRIISLRNSGLPYQLNLLRREEINIQQFAGRSEENRQISDHELHDIQNIRKRYLGQLTALQDPAFVAQKARKEKELRQRIAKNSLMRSAYGDAWDMVAAAEKQFLRIHNEYNLLEGGVAFNTRLFSIARTIVRLADEDAKPNGKRLQEFRDSNRDSLLQRLYSSAPIYKNLEQHQLTDALAYLAEAMGSDTPLVKKILEGQSPTLRAQMVIADTKLGSVEERKRLVAGGKRTTAESHDLFIALVLLVDKRARSLRKIYETEVKEVREQAYAKIAKAQFELYGQNLYPDATFTLRLTFGRTLGYMENGKKIPHRTTIGGTFTHAESHQNKEPWELPASWQNAQPELYASDRDFNFVTTHDTHGGNSGSPIFDADLNIVGLLFDGNIYANADTFMYGDEVSRSISVHTAGITEVLRKVYHTDRLIEELLP